MSPVKIFRAMQRQRFRVPANRPEKTIIGECKMFRASSETGFFRTRHMTAAGLLAAAMCGSAGAVTITEFALPDAGVMPTSIVGAPDGNLWFTELLGSKIGKISPQGQITEYPLTGTYPTPIAITVANDGTLWFLNYDRIGRMTTAGQLTEYPLPFGSNSDALGIAPGPDGNIWFTESRCPLCDPNASTQLPNDGGTIGKITPRGEITEYTLPDYHAGPYGITAGPDGNLWFTEYNSSKIGRISPTGAVTEFALPEPYSFPMGITAGSDGNLWFVENPSHCTKGDLCEFAKGNLGNQAIGRITPTGIITEFPLLTADWGGPEMIGIVEGADHAMWFTEPRGNRIGRITHSGVITEFFLPDRPYDPNIYYPGKSSDPTGIANGPDGNVWFVEAAINTGARIAKVELGSTPAEQAPPDQVPPDQTAPVGVPITPGFTGSWYDPSQSGHGFSIEILPDNQMLADWYVFAPNGGQSWIVAMGPISGNTAVLQASQAVGPGGQFPPNFNPARVNAKAWGTITVTFTDCNNGQASWQPTAAGYTSGSMPIARLTQPAGLSCP